jgi:cytochrome oxidase Cu insertion factor (SCO1/SenC/PrrC family)
VDILPKAPAKRGRLILLAIGVVFALPILAAWTAYLLHWSPGGTSNYGDLIKPRPVPDTPLVRLDGKPFRLSQLRGKWVMLAFDRPGCDESCVRKLYYMRQIRVAQGESMDRVERVWILTGAGKPSAALLAAYPGMQVAREPSPQFESGFPAADGVVHHVYLIDPRGNVMMRFPRDPNPSRMLKDLQHLLKYSSAG